MKEESLHADHNFAPQSTFPANFYFDDVERGDLGHVRGLCR